ncbi:serine hydrolase domain-containing protein [uncultured Pontibacter sp.]|uniref:serine hydrolase domain-containing protein n=1 Tax=uncultured Pontibacter sp. TaxID=453356 RepID=UPI002624A0BB|nr:serine hydrolase domain-containing protein [uncultured Pontibacter sp.]
MLFLTFVACQDTSREEKQKQEDTVANQLESRQQVQVPASFTPAYIHQLNIKLDSVFSYLHKKKGFNGAVLVTKYDQVIYKGAFGYADFQRKDTLRTHTAFQLASVSKQFTAMAIMLLKEQGKLTYEDSVQQHLPQFPYRGITIRQLLTHRSGLPNYTYFSDKLWSDRNKAITNDDVLHLMEAHQPQVYYQPGTRFDYSNTGYFLLASIVEKVAGMPFSTYLEQHVFSPLHMNHTFTYNQSIAEKAPNVATGHTGGRRKRSPDYLDTVLGDKGIYSTVEDLYKWDQALYTNKLVKQETLREAFTGSRLERKKEEDYGFGWRIRPLDNGDTVVYHGGLWHGYATYLQRNPKDHSALIVLSNVPNGSFRHLKEVQQVLYPDKNKAE